jgi:hypothetical protein
MPCQRKFRRIGIPKHFLRPRERTPWSPPAPSPPASLRRGYSCVPSARWRPVRRGVGWGGTGADGWGRGALGRVRPEGRRQKGFCSSYPSSAAELLDGLLALVVRARSNDHARPLLTYQECHSSPTPVFLGAGPVWMQVPLVGRPGSPCADLQPRGTLHERGSGQAVGGGMYAARGQISRAGR